MSAALALAERGVGRTGKNPSVGCILVGLGRIVGRGWTQPGGRPHAEAMALAEAGAQAAGATAYVTLEPCFHRSPRGPACARLLVEAGIGRVVVALQDPDPRTAGKGLAYLRDAGIEVVTGIAATEAAQTTSGFLTRITLGRPLVTLKLATSLDGMIAMPDGSSQWITGEAARAHTHIERLRTDAILVGAGTYRSDRPRLDVRLPGLDDRNPRRILLTRNTPPEGWEAIQRPDDIGSLDCNTLMIEGGAETAASFLTADLVDRLLLYRAPIIIGTGTSCIADIGLRRLDESHGRWHLVDTRLLGNDRLERYERTNRQGARA